MRVMRMRGFGRLGAETDFFSVDDLQDGLQAPQVPEAFQRVAESIKPGGSPRVLAEFVARKTEGGTRQVKIRVPEGLLGGTFERHRMKTIVGVSVGVGALVGGLVAWKLTG